MPRGAAWGEAQSANAKCRRQNAKSGDGGIEVRSVGDDVHGVPNYEKQKNKNTGLIYAGNCSQMGTIMAQKYFTFCDFVTYKRKKLWYNKHVKKTSRSGSAAERNLI